jgi:hypothetical protein
MKALILTGVLLFSCVASAQTEQTTDNLVYTSVNPAPPGTNIGSSWSGFSVVTSTGGNTTSDNGAVTGYNMNTGTFMFGYNQGTIAYTYAINQALANAGTGIQVRGYNWSWEINNLNYDNRQGNVDTLTARILTYAPNNVDLRRVDTWTYNTKFDWTTFSGTVNYITPGAPSEFGNMQIEFTGRDTGFWAGYYGPQVRNIDVRLRYGVDECLANPLSSPDCPGYQQAYLTQQCTANPLYDSSCTGYAMAYHDQQCSINPLYASTCPGYQQAYFTQQCSANPLYDTACPGYQQAYFDQQCTANPLYDNQCPGYAAAYFNQQCGLDPFYDQSCAGYQQAYYSLQCSISPLYDSGCPGYQQAYYDQQCAANPLYDSGCANYDIVSAATKPPAQEDTTTVVAQEDTTTASSSASEPTAAASATSPTSVSPAAVVSTVRPSAPAAAPAPSARGQAAETQRQETRAAEQKSEQKKTDRAVARAVPRGAKGQAAQRAAEEKAEEAVADAANATTIEAQQAAQNLVLGLMGYNSAFSAYQNALVPDTNAAVMARQYNQPTVDNRRALRALSGASDRVHQDMVDQQYGRMP